MSEYQVEAVNVVDDRVISEKAFETWTDRYRRECDLRQTPALVPDRHQTGDGFDRDGWIFSDDFILRDAQGRSIAVCTDYCGECHADPRYPVENREDARLILDPDGTSAHPDGAVGELREAIEAVVRERYPLAANLPPDALAKLVGLTLSQPRPPAEAVFGLDEEKLLKAVLDKAVRVEKVLNLEHGATTARIVEHFRKRPASMGVSELIRVLKWLEDGFGDIL